MGAGHCRAYAVLSAFVKSCSSDLGWRLCLHAIQLAHLLGVVIAQRVFTRDVMTFTFAVVAYAQLRQDRTRNQMWHCPGSTSDNAAGSHGAQVLRLCKPSQIRERDARATIPGPPAMHSQVFLGRTATPRAAAVTRSWLAVLAVSLLVAACGGGDAAAPAARSGTGSVPSYQSAAELLTLPQLKVGSTLSTNVKLRLKKDGSWALESKGTTRAATPADRRKSVV